MLYRDPMMRKLFGSPTRLHCPILNLNETIQKSDGRQEHVRCTHILSWPIKDYAEILGRRMGITSNHGETAHGSNDVERSLAFQRVCIASILHAKAKLCRNPLMGKGVCISHTTYLDPNRQCSDSLSCGGLWLTHDEISFDAGRSDFQTRLKFTHEDKTNCAQIFCGRARGS